jgi:hypothetical protein
MLKPSLFTEGRQAPRNIHTSSEVEKLKGKYSLTDNLLDVDER